MNPFTVLSASFAMLWAITATAIEPITIGEQRQLFVDNFLIDRMDNAQIQVERPQAREVVLVTDQPWEGNTCAYYTLFQDGDKYRMYYRGSHWDEVSKRATHREVVCYAESVDGVTWIKPPLGLYEFEGSKENNIVWDGVGSHNFTPFKDTNPNCKPQARYKALARGRSLNKNDTSSKHGLFAFRSPDGIHWELMHDEPVITEGAFDSQNLAFYDQVAGVYRDYHRWFNKGKRDIMQAQSTDFLTWTKPVPLKYTETAREHLYTNAIRQYERAPQIFLGFPTRYLPNQGQRVEPVFMSSRDGLHFQRWSDALIPEDAPADRNGNRSNYMAWGLLQLPGQKRELSVYATEAYYTGPNSRLRRFAYRLDGFASVTSDNRGGNLLTKPLVFTGDQLEINYQTSSTGSIRVELQELDGTPIKGLASSDCQPVSGDSTAHQVQWGVRTNLQALAEKPIRIMFEMEDANLYSFRFR
ncbi:MAG: hypothetical protein P8L85_15880 [Rubripirellula sp.]|nr:hypothetical protein [Rubripirellula sp.]